MTRIRTLLLALSAICAVTFGTLFVMSVVSPGYVEQVAKEVIRYQVERKVHEKVDAIDARFMASRAAVVVKHLGDEIA